jgi:hypothetical protein
MRKVIGVIIICSSVILLMGGEEMVAYGQETRPPGSDEVLIGPNAIIIPLGRILLVRKDLDYCGIKFTRFWTGKTLDDQYAAYESYYQGDKTGDFSNSKVGTPFTLVKSWRSFVALSCYCGLEKGRYIFSRSLSLKVIMVLSLGQPDGQISRG